MRPRHTSFAVVLASFFFAVSGCGHKSSTSQAGNVAPAAAPPAEPAPASPAAPLGKPAGPAASGTIGFGGGALKSADGRVSIEVPPGVIPGDTVFAIQPLENSEPNGIGPVYVLAPEGMTFAQPVTLTWHLTDADLAGHPIEAVSIATRDAQGEWILQPGVERDAAAKTVRVTTVHLSPWEAANASLTITPDHAEVRVRKSVSLTVSTGPPESDADDLTPPRPATPAGQPSGGESDSDLLTAPTAVDRNSTGSGDELSRPIATICRWRVNGGSGDATVGSLSVQANDAVEFNAPAKVPPINPAVVSCEMTRILHGRRVKTIAVAYVKVTDQKGWKLTFNYAYNASEETSGPNGRSVNEEERHISGSLDLAGDPMGYGLVSGRGTATLASRSTGTKSGSMCKFIDVTSMAGPMEIEAQGAAGALTLSMHSEKLSQRVEHNGGACSEFPPSTQSWDNASFSVSCQIVGIDFDNDRTYSAPSDHEDGHGTCTVRITPE